MQTIMNNEVVIEIQEKEIAEENKKFDAEICFQHRKD